MSRCCCYSRRRRNIAYRRTWHNFCCRFSHSCFAPLLCPRNWELSYSCALSIIIIVRQEESCYFMSSISYYRAQVDVGRPHFFLSASPTVPQSSYRKKRCCGSRQKARGVGWTLFYTEACVCVRACVYVLNNNATHAKHAAVLRRRTGRTPSRWCPSDTRRRKIVENAKQKETLYIYI